MASYIWRSILHGRELLEKGIRWRVGNGKSIRAFHDPWLPHPGSFKIITPLCFLSELVTVSNLICIGRWKRDLLSVLFCNRDQELILKIPISPMGGMGTMIWHYTPNGIFTVSSCYKLGLKMEQLQNAGCSSPRASWDIIWSCKLPPKVHAFAWKLCHNSLATGANLHKRKIRPSAICICCSHLNEDDIHIFFKCQFAAASWKEINFSPTKFLDKATSWLHMLELIQDMPKSPTMDLEKFIICLWGLWRSRNKAVFTNHKTQPKQTMEKALNFLKIFQRREINSKESLAHKLDHPSRWFPPDAGWIMLNIDASFSSSGAGYGFVVRDHNGVVLKSGAGLLSGITSAEHGELMAMWRSFSLVQEYWNMPIILDIDSQHIVSESQQKEPNMTVLGGLLDNFKCFVLRDKKCVIKFCPRLANHAAHCLAKTGFSLTSEVLWLYSSHPSVLDSLHSNWSSIL